jgi:2-oxoglutarate ferredoxin oxidoreductase subunit gamma
VRYEIGILGSGGQGVLLMGTLLAKAAAVSDNIFVAETRSYDTAVRGAKAQSNLVMSDEEIDYPGILGFDLLLLLAQQGSKQNIEKLKPQALLVVDSGLVREVIWSRILRIPFTRIAREKFSDERAANMIALGALTQLCEYFPPSAVEASISSSFKGDILALNLSCFREGVEITKTRKAGFETVEDEDTTI